ncbi:MAG TPA: 50S ribosomal protein L23 [Patescibacteria group bacterium]|nr:50S ribosomal protein L23 [Patescibacteria group bacterium]
MKNFGEFIIKPIISEKSFAEARSNRYTFLVAKAASKTDIKNAVEKVFGVKVKGVATANIKGSKTINTRKVRKTKDTTYKKATVLVAEGQKIEIFDESTGDDKK